MSYAMQINPKSSFTLTAPYHPIAGLNWYMSPNTKTNYSPAHVSFFFILHVISINLHRLWASYCRSTQTVRAERCGLYHIATSALTFTIMNIQWAYTTLRLYRLGSVCTLYSLYYTRSPYMWKTIVAAARYPDDRTRSNEPCLLYTSPSPRD